MRDVIFAVLMGIGVLLACLWVAGVLFSLEPPRLSEPLHNVYWPYSVETAVRDR